MFKSQVACALQFMCQHIVLNYAIFPELMLL